MKITVSRLMVRVTGFKPSRIKEWQRAVASEARVVGPLRLAGSLIKGALGLGGVDRGLWRQRARACRACPVFDRANRKCRDTAGLGLGCGCYMPAKSLVRVGACWISKAAPGSGHGFV